MPSMEAIVEQNEAYWRKRFTDPATGKTLTETWHRSHPIAKTCPSCGDRVDIVGIHLLAYTFEPCPCSVETYEHLVETLWHRACLNPVVCESFQPPWIRGRPNRPGHYMATCSICGRTERTHP